LSVSLLFKNKIHGKYFPMVRAARRAGTRAQTTKKEIREREGEENREGEEKKGEELVPSQLLRKLSRAFPPGAPFTLGMVRQRYANPRRPSSAAVKRAVDVLVGDGSIVAVEPAKINGQPKPEIPKSRQ